MAEPLNLYFPVGYRRKLIGFLLIAVGVLASCGGGEPIEPVKPLANNALKAQLGEPPPPPAIAPPFIQDKRVRRELPGGSAGGYAINTADREAVKNFFQSVYLSSEGVPSDWQGDIDGCNAGQTSPAFQQAALRRINWFRAMAGVPANVTFGAQYSAQAQQAALMMSANRQLNHYPPPAWQCYSTAGAEGAKLSNLYLGRTGSAAVSGFILDPGDNNGPVGHRRWILYPQTQMMGIGDVHPGSGSGFQSASALWVMDSNYFAARPITREEFVAWPPKGFAPYQVVYPRWSFSFPNANFSNAQVTMTENGSAIAVRLEPLADYADKTLVWIPGNYTHSDTWRKPAADTEYQVTIHNVIIGGQARTFTYSTTVFDPEAASGPANQLVIVGSNDLVTKQRATFSFQGVAGSTSYESRQLQLEAYPLFDGAETSTSNFSGSDPILTTNTVSASGRSSFHLNNAGGLDKWMRVQPLLVANASSNLVFKSRLALATASQVALIEISTNAGTTWTPIYRQTGGNPTNSGESSFSTRQVSLAAYAGKPFHLRFRFAFENAPDATYYGVQSIPYGWYIDDIQMQGMSSAEPVVTTTTASGSIFDTQIDAPGSYALQVRPLMYDQVGDWGTLAIVNVKAVTAAGLPPSSFNRVFAWAEFRYPGLLANGTENRSLPNGTIYRCYINNFCIGYLAGRFLTYDGVTLRDVGGEADFLPAVQAAGF